MNSNPFVQVLAMNFRNFLIACICVSLAGCSTFGDAEKKKDDNVAYFIAPEISSDGASARKKPMKPKQAVADSVHADASVGNVEFEKLHEKVSTYTVCVGDTLYGIARKFDMSPSDLISMNGLTNESRLVVGQRLKVFGDVAAKDAMPPDVAAMTVYTVQAGDSLSKIARKCGISLDALRKANDLQSDQLQIGQKLNVPPSSHVVKDSNSWKVDCSPMQLGGDGKYAVRQGDSLYVIAKNFGVRQSDLREANGIENPNHLRVGQKLTIPTRDVSVQSTSDQEVVGVAQYTVRSGDSIGQIAKTFEVLESDLIELNNLDKSSALQVGKKLLIPQKKIPFDRKSASTNAERSNDFFNNFEEIPVIEVK
ncbi:MAG: LysM peptidoglycan-binding domain-containing protein [Puniceicoccales bacterium]|jgi:LysM repeat protein|nr:LysM peptidoglycan-binding domain-containing protein [Puniceicoccales bacterium]